MDSQIQGGGDYDSSGSNDNKIQRRRRISLIVMLVSLFGLVLVGAYNHQKEMAKPEFCNRCHQMNGAYNAWQSASHSKVDCTVCHKNVSIAWDLYRQKMGYTQVNEKNIVVDDKACQSCHSDARVITPPYGLLVPHTLHLAKGIACTECHKAVTHGILAQAVSSHSKSEAAQTTAQIAGGNDQYDPNRISMAACMKCHNGAMAASSCNACHADKNPPDSHKAGDFSINHGYLALNNTASCNNCHQYDQVLQAQYKPKGQGWDAAWSFARSTAFCANCHQNRPASHHNLYTVNHGPTATQDENRCLTCHNKNEKGRVSEKPATNITCAQCHYNQHPSNWIQIHPQQISKDNQAKCFDCHDYTSCNDCHNKTFRAKR